MSEPSTASSTTQMQNAPETIARASNTGSIQDPEAGNWESDVQKYFASIVAGGVAGGCLLLFLLVVVVVMLWRRRSRRRSAGDIEDGKEKGGRIYDEIAEGKKQKQKDKKKERKTKGKQWDKDNNNVSAIELVAIDTAPDIITAHDNESIYETLDGRRAARAKAGHVTVEGQSESCNVRGPMHGSYVMTQDATQDSTYDHLHRFHKPRPPHQPPAIPEKRFTDPEVTTRPKVPPKPRLVHSADEEARAGGGLGNRDGGGGEEMGTGCGAVDWFGTGPAESLTDSVRSSLTELARQSVSGGKRIVCQLTMVGVVENGKPVPLKPPAASNAYFILEPSRDSVEQGEEPSQRSPAPKFRFRSEASRDDERQGGDVGAGASDYFVLEPLKQQNDLEEFIDTQHPQCFVDCRKRESQDSCSEGGQHGSQCSLHVRYSVDSFLSLKGDSSSQSFARFHSCPGECPSKENADSPPPLPPKHLTYRRSFSSPQSSQYRRTRKDSTPAQKKMDAETLKARIQQEMMALGFLGDTDTYNDVDDTVSNRDSMNSDIVPCSERPATNDYYVLEPQLSSEEEDQAKTDPEVQFPSTRGTDSGRNKPRCHQRQQAPTPPPRQPGRNGHNRSKSEAPLMNSDKDQSGEQGPVIVSLKKNRPSDKYSGGATAGKASRDDDHREPFRPRFKSESGVLPERLKRH